MNLIKELLSLKEVEQGENLTDMKQSPEKNLKAVDLILRSGGDIPIGKESRNQLDKMGSQDGSTMFFVSINPPHGDVEAYVVVDKSGKFSYYDFTDEVVVINGKLVHSDPTTSEWRDEMEDLISEYKLESGTVANGGIAAFMSHLKSAYDGSHRSNDDD